MASVPPNPTALTPPRVAFLDPRTGAISREWYRFFLSLLNATEETTAANDITPDAVSLTASLEQQIGDVFNLVGVLPPPTGGTVTYVGASGGTTGLTFSGSPITGSGTLVLGGTLGFANGGTGLTATPANGQLLIGNAAGYTLSTLTAGTAISVSNAAGSITITNTAPDQIVSLTGAGTTVVTGTYPNFTITSNDAYSGTVTSVNLTAGTGISVSGGPITTAGSITVTNTAPDQVVSLTGAGTTVVTGTYPNFTITSNDQYSGTVTSVAMSVPTGFTVSGSPITTSGTLGLAFASGYSLPTTASQTNWDTAYSERLQWNGGATNLVAATGRTSLGATTVGSSFFTLTNPSAITFPRINADNSVSALTASDFRTAIGAGTGSGTVTSVSGTGTVNGITLTGTVTSSGSLTLGGTLSGVSLTTQVTGTLPVANGGTGATTLTGYVKGNGTSAFTASSTVPAADVTGLATVATSGSFADLSNKPGFATNGQNVITGSKTLGSSDKGTNLLIVTSGITITFPSSGYASGEGVLISNVSGGNVTFSFAYASDMGTTFPNGASIIAICDGGGFWRQYCYSTSRL